MSRMKSRHYALLAAALAVPGIAQATPEKEANNPIAVGQTVEITAAQGQTTGGAVIDAVIGNLSGAAVLDTDYFVFEGREGDVVTFDIDGGIGGGRDVDTILGVFGPAPAYVMLRTNDDGGTPLDPGSVSGLDSRIVNFRLPASGAYTVGVSSFPRRFANGGGTTSNSLGSRANGDYTLLISGVTVPVLQINIDIKPGGSDQPSPVNPRSKGKVPVALFGSSEFAVDDVDQASLTFGHSGDEASLAKCNAPKDINGDLWPDMLCHFENQVAAFDGTEDEAIMRGKLTSGRKFEGRGWLKIVPVKAQE
ncbi:MAG: hypothetical protein ACREE7_15765 [Dongiaceae bacterium]